MVVTSREGWNLPYGKLEYRLQVQYCINIVLYCEMLSFNSYWRQVDENQPGLAINEVYEMWFKALVLIEGPVGESNKMFTRFFQNIQVRSVSEVLQGFTN